MIDEIVSFNQHTLEHAERKISYFLTVTLKPKLYKYCSITQLELTNNIVFGLLYRCTDSFVVVAEHTKAGNIHYHAIICLKSDYQKIHLINSLKKRKELGFIHVDSNPVINPKDVSEYLTKDLYTNHQIFRKNSWKIHYKMCDCLYRELYDIDNSNKSN